MTTSFAQRALQLALRGRLPRTATGGDARLVTGLETLLHSSQRTDALYVGHSLRTKTWGFSLPIRHADDLHMLTIAASGEGKGRTLWHPNGMTYPGGLLAFDINGEAALLQHKARMRLGQHVHLLDPFDVAPVALMEAEASYNPLDELAFSVSPADDCLRFAAALHPKGEDLDKYWHQATVRCTAGLIAHALLKYEDPTLPDILDFYQMPEAQLLEEVAQAWAYTEDGPLERLAKGMAATLSEAEPKARHTIQESARNDLSIFDSDQMRLVLRSSSLLFSGMKASPSSVYVVLPEDMVASHGPWLRIVTTAALSAMSRDPTVPKHRVLCVLDEFANLGNLDVIAKGISFLRDKHVKLWPIVQDIGQLEAIYGDAWTTIENNVGATVVLGIGDNKTAAWASAKCGITRLRRGWLAKGPDPKQQVPLLTPDQIARFCARGRGYGLLLPRGCNPVPFRRVGYDQLFRAGIDYDPLPQFATAKP